MNAAPWLWQLREVRVGSHLHIAALDLAPGCTAITGPSGAGKSTLLGVLSGFIAPGAGSVVRAPGDTRLPVFWACGGAALWPGVVAARQLVLAAPSGVDPSSLLATYDLQHRADVPPEALSAGERDRLDVARAEASAAAVLILDEPFAHCGRAQAEALWRGLRERAAAAGTSLVVATHDPLQTASADRVLTLEGGRLVAGLLALALLAGCGAAPDVTVSAFALPAEADVLPTPRAVGPLRDGGMMVLDTAGRVLDYGPDLALRTSWHMPAWDVGRPEGICELPDGRLVVADTHYHRIVVFARGGAVLATWGREGDAPGEFRWPVGVACDPQGRIYISEYGGNDRIQRLAPDGTPQLAFGTFGSGPGRLQRPQGLAWVAGKVLVSDALNARVAVFSEDGAWLGEQAAGALTMPYGCSAAGDGLALADYGAQRAVRLDAAGAVVATWGEGGRGAGQLATPWAAAIDSAGRAWICDTGNRRVQVVSW